MMLYKVFFKRLIDLVISLSILIILTPILILVAILLLINNEGKPFFFQYRPGKDGRVFKIIKFRTMNEKRDVHGHLLSDKERLTRLGNLIRKTSIDELPQLINVVKGEMSLIGPRPLLLEYMELYSAHEKRRHEVRPGITGWAQVNGRNSIDWKSKFNLDIYYVDNLTFMLDCKIFIMTLHRIIAPKDISIVPVKRLVDEKREANESV